eukprot:6492264-Amphidinium_carterae.3
MRSRFWLPDGPDLEQQVRAALEDAVHPGSAAMQQWKKRGMIVSWRMALNEAIDKRIFVNDPVCKENLMRHTETPLRAQIKLRSLPSIFTCKARLSDRIWKWLWRFLGQNYARKEQMAAVVLGNVKLLCSLSSPAVAMAAARVILGGVRFRDDQNPLSLEGCRFCGRGRQCSMTEAITT